MFVCVFFTIHFLGVDCYVAFRLQDRKLNLGLFFLLLFLDLIHVLLLIQHLASTHWHVSQHHPFPFQLTAEDSGHHFCWVPLPWYTAFSWVPLQLILLNCSFLFHLLQPYGRVPTELKSKSTIWFPGTHIAIRFYCKHTVNPVQFAFHSCGRYHTPGTITPPSVELACLKCHPSLHLPSYSLLSLEDSFLWSSRRAEPKQQLHAGSLPLLNRWQVLAKCATCLTRKL